MRLDLTGGEPLPIQRDHVARQPLEATAVLGHCHRLEGPRTVPGHRQVGDPARFDRESKFARWCGTGAVALSSGEGSGQPIKHRLDLRGNRRINSVLHIASATQARSQPDAAAYLARKTGEGKTRREARQAHKRHLANRVIRRMRSDEQHRQHTRHHAV